MNPLPRWGLCFPGGWALVHTIHSASVSLRAKSLCTGPRVQPRWLGAAHCHLPWVGLPMRGEGEAPALLGAPLFPKALTVTRARNEFFSKPVL